jgi:hypothetical protein
MTFQMVALQPSSWFCAAHDSIHPFPKMRVNTSILFKKGCQILSKTVQKILAKYSINFPTDFM